MENPIHRLGDLFRQLGLSDEPADIEAFLTKHRPQPGHLTLAELPIWTPSQAAFLREEIAKDGDWAELVDIFSVLLGR
ncbi:MAG: DUF2789 domain-containing protein [Betaproteobacteria bacterium]|uniref:DUF2789 domain-containing protein n=1 Tax=Candidatus Proximibacter danicus TaxID=2954365 RepID=A0A9D7K4L0_9PROT|nr:DUF2789 domain-containing protein [Candidatus Proximibacter danicus]